MSRFGAFSKTVFLFILLLLVVLIQYEYDATLRALSVSVPSTLSPEMVRLTDMGFNSTVASFLWAGTMPEILDLFINGHTEYISDLAYLNAVDPKLSYPYAFSVLTLPAVPTSSYPAAISESFVIGREGLANADADWRIPYYMAINYYLDENDLKDATWYFNIAANTPGVPGYAESFALNFGIGANDRDKVKALWETIYESTNDPDTKARAAAYVERLDDFDYLQQAAGIYKQKYGAYPTSTEELVTTGVIPAVPVDPFGYTFIFRAGGVPDIDLTHLPAYIQEAPQE
ncbi:MAG TPA: hypothetical protein VHZ04_02000 [Candidatus Paceibacterota bacterium]|jgi:hypothetical protein|nr:hypothetical protein [Candidatus Paceibacterota bacterium]